MKPEVQNEVIIKGGMLECGGMKEGRWDERGKMG